MSWHICVILRGVVIVTKLVSQTHTQMLAKFAEDDRIELMNAQKRRMKQQEHKRAVEDLIADRREQFAQDKAREVAERQDEENLEKLRMEIIEEERQRLLKEHATKLLGYLPKVNITVKEIKMCKKACGYFLQKTYL